MTRRRPAAALVAGALVLTLAGVPAAGSPMAAFCQVVVPSPEFARDRTVFCVYRDDSTTPMRLAVSTDGGRTWVPARAEGLTRDGLGIGLGIALSPAYAQDRTLFATVNTGTYTSRDNGATFTLVDSLASAGRQGNPVPFVATGPSLPGVPSAARATRLYLAYAATHRAARVDVAARRHEPAAGAPLASLFGFVAHPGGLLALGYETTGLGERVAVVYGCSPTLLCAKQFVFPAGVEPGTTSGLPVQPALDARTVVVRMYDAAGRVRLWRSVDAGRTFAPWAAADTLLAAANRSSGSRPSVTMAVDPGNRRRVYLRVSTFPRYGAVWAPDAPPAEQLFRSDDAGTTWHRVAFARGEGQRGPRGSLPWTAPTAGEEGSAVVAATGSALFAVGYAPWAPGTVFCSRDGGVHWSRSC